MIYTRYTLNSIEETVTRPSLITIVDDIKKHIGVSKDTYVNIDTTTNTNVKKKVVDRAKLGIANDYTEDIVLITYDENSLNGNELDITPMATDFKPIYEDKEVDSKITPIFHQRTGVINFTFKSKSKNKANALVNKLRLMTSSDSMYIRHELEYHYILPLHVVSLIDTINQLKELRNIDKLSLDDYVNSTFDNRVDFSNTHDGVNYKSELVIREAQVAVQGYISDQLHDIKSEYDEKDSYWGVTFNFNFDFEKPVSLLLQYPIMVYNTLIPKVFRTFNKQNQVKDNALRTHRMSALSDVTSIEKKHYENYYRVIPELDQIELTDTYSHVAKVVSVMAKVNDADPNELFSLFEIPGLKFKDSVSKFIKDYEYPYMGKVNESLFLLELYKNNKPDYNNEIIVDADGNMRTKEPMSYKYTYRVVISIILDLDYLVPDSKKRVKKFIEEEARKLEELIENGEDSKLIAYNYSKDNLINNYITLLDIPKEYVDNSINVSKTHSDVLFNIKESNIFTFKTKQLVMNMVGLFKNQEERN